MLSALRINKKIIPYPPFHRAINETLKIPGKVLATSVFEFYHSSVGPRYYMCANRQLFLLYVNRCPLMCVAEVISWYAFNCQPSRNVFENKMTLFR